MATVDKEMESLQQEAPSPSPGAGSTERELETKLSGKPALERNDLVALTEEQQQALDQHKIKTRIESELYLRKHPEVGVMLRSFVSEVLLSKPKSIRQHAAAYFTDPSLPDKVKAEIKNQKLHSS